MFFRFEDFNFEGKRVLLRTDFNVPLSQGQIVNDSRIRKTLPTINSILKQNPHQLIILSHLDRPGGDYNPELSLRPVAEHLQKLLNKDVYFEINPRVNNITTIPEEKIVVLENLRFDKVEENNDIGFSRKLAGFADLFVFDAFGVSHRTHASVVGVPQLIPTCAGLLMEKEISFLGEKMEKPERPFIAIIGGAKQGKIRAIEKLLQKADHLIIGGVLANTFLKAEGYHIGTSKYSEEDLEYAKQLIQQFPSRIDLPVDYIIADKFAKDAQTRVAGNKDNIDGWKILDIGPYTISGYKKLLGQAKTVVWAGPVGVFEWESFRRGTWDIANYLARLNITKIIGGGESAAAIEYFNLEKKMTHVSTGGGASLELLAGNELPGIRALQDNYNQFKEKINK